ncbi:uncharacterized protein N7483_010181 [Penicillium malachiteum]|uniref:uncharacterized protein n=1 Tax=Penicillium malachiteum TaxID=1324776 RepID=UPI002546F7A5|nr:uncharacterized protein N7483_010181 [Penicillium malachiteum]KAJ5713000.1 hypothetical protein N7483_010181 [Penicillium malachiteum]
MTLLVVHSDQYENQQMELEQLIRRSSIRSTILSVESQVHFDTRENVRDEYRNAMWPISFPAPPHLLTGCIIRPDSIIYAAAESLQHLERYLEALQQSFS